MTALMARAMVVAMLVLLAALAVERAVPMRDGTRWIWGAAILCGALLPWAGGLLGWAPHIVPWARILAEVAPHPASPNPGSAIGPLAPAPSFEPASYVLVGWTLTSVVLATLFSLSALRLRRMLRNSTRARLEGVPVHLTPDLGPVVIGFFRPCIAVPRWLLALAPAEIRLALTHEREHVQAGDTRLLAGAVAICALMPWNLPLWWMARRLARAVEVDCDARVLAVHDAAEYGRLLLRVAGHAGAPRPVALALGGAGADLRRRILAMSTPTKRFRIAAALPLLAAGLTALVVACDAVGDPTEPNVPEGAATDPAAVKAEVPDGPEFLITLTPPLARVLDEAGLTDVWHRMVDPTALEAPASGHGADAYEEETAFRLRAYESRSAAATRDGRPPELSAPVGGTRFRREGVPTSALAPGTQQTLDWEILKWLPEPAGS